MYREEMVMRLQNGEDPLELSIEKWESLLEQAKTDANEFDGFEFSSSTCALCYIYRYVKNQVDCGSCPVFEVTNLPYCHNTPYEKARS